MDSLPIDAVLPQLIADLRRSSAAVLQAPTGAGKTTRVPPALLDAGVAGKGIVVMLEPRRLAARAAARRIAEERGSRFGGEVGYAVRFDQQYSRQTRILVVTEGVFLRFLQDDPFLEKVGAVVFDEFHERSLNSDLALALARTVQREARADLRLVVMSATLNPQPIAAFLGDCPVVVSEGRLHPVAVEYLGILDSLDPRGLPAAVRVAVKTALVRTSGDVLVFLPGVGEIRRAADEFAGLARDQNVILAELYGDLPPERQDAALRGAERRKIVLATNVAETSVTVEGVTAVVDSGMARVLSYDAAVGLDRLSLRRISRASADQRAGRAGRQSPGHCLRLWSERDHARLLERDAPEIERVDLAGTVLELRCWGERDVEAFGWFEPPPKVALQRAETLLEQLGAIGPDGAATALGRSMVRLPVHPRLARLVLEGARLGEPERAALAAAMLAERDPFPAPRERRPAAHVSESDVLDRIALLEDFEAAGRRHGSLGEVNVQAAKFLFRARDQLLRSVAQEHPGPVAPGGSADEAVLKSLLAAFPDRLARRREKGSARALMVGGRGLRLLETSAVTNAELFLAVDVQAGGAEDVVRLASVVERSWLSADRLTVREDVEFDGERERIVTIRRTQWMDLVLEEAVLSNPDGAAVASALAEAAAGRLERALSLDDPDVAQFRARVACLREWMPEASLPSLDDERLRSLLPDLCVGRRSFEELRKAPLLGFLKSVFTPLQLQLIDREAPEQLAVPSGSRIGLHYEVGRPPVLAVRIQELFGLADTPRIAGGRAPVLLHLLAPNHRPQQVTHDLRSFWNNTYQLVRKELRARYPRHAWPEDPWNAPPERRPQRRPPRT